MKNGRKKNRSARADNQTTATQIVAASNVTANEQGGVDIAPPKTPEELQQEAEESGWLTIWHEFNWWFSWYRFHIVYILDGQQQFDVGIGFFWRQHHNSISAVFGQISGILGRHSARSIRRLHIR